MNWIKENIQTLPSFSNYSEQVHVIENYVQSNPSLCIETCKALIEGICKTILMNKNIQFDHSLPFAALVKFTLESILNLHGTERTDLLELTRRVCGVAQKLGEIRNSAGFASHGMDILNPKLSEGLSVFCLRVTDSIGGFILRCYNNNKVLSLDHRIHYDDCRSFNEYFDETNPMTIGSILVSASKCLYDQDYEAYKETFFDYLAQLQQ